MIVTMQMCKSMDGPLSASAGGYAQDNLFCEYEWPTCTCPAYKYSKATINFGGRMVKPECKHIRKAQDDACGWHEQWSHERQTKESICPRCGGPTVSVRVLV